MSNCICGARGIDLDGHECVPSLKHELFGLKAELDGWKDGSDAVKNEYAGLILRTNHKIERLQTEVELLRGTLRKLANEASGFLGMSDIERHGQTNSRILRQRIDEAREDCAVTGNEPMSPAGRQNKNSL